MKTLEETITHCSNCGKETTWDFSLGNKPLCADCWDTECENEELIIPKDSAWWSAENEKSDERTKNREACHRYQESHIERWKGKDGYWQRWNETHREERKRMQREYYMRHREKIREAQHQRYLIRKQLKELEKKRRKT